MHQSAEKVENLSIFLSDTKRKQSGFHRHASNTKNGKNAFERLLSDTKNPFSVFITS
jgi:hypothetical protein